jgi:hypothetical protein
MTPVSHTTQVIKGSRYYYPGKRHCIAGNHISRVMNA